MIITLCCIALTALSMPVKAHYNDQLFADNLNANADIITNNANAFNDFVNITYNGFVLNKYNKLVDEVFRVGDLVDNNAGVFNDFISMGFNPLVNTVTGIGRQVAIHDQDVVNLQGQINTLTKEAELSTDSNDIGKLREIVNKQTLQIAQLQRQVDAIRRHGKK
jgi:hypothetical protein